jgi:hypothetical protein
MRAVADVAADADPYTGAAVYDSTPPHAGDPPPGWLTLGGTSLASPIIAATFALAGGVPGASSYGAQALYEGARTVGGSMHAVGSGSNGECAQPFNAEGLSGCTVLEEAASCGDQAICVAGQGYSGPAGLGTPEGICAFQPLGTCTPARGSLGSGSQAGKETRTPGGTTSTSGADTGARSALGGAPPPSAPPGKARAASVSHFSLTPRALAALHRARGARRARPVGRSQIAFTYVLSRADHVSVTLERQVGRDGKARWRAASPVATLSARAGRNRGRLAGAAALTPGAYLLTLRPARGPERSLRFTVR